MSESEARRRLLDLRERIVSGGADFAELARVHSDDGTAARGGELDWVYPGDTVPEFERAYEELKIGEVSQPVRTPFGYHLIQVLERRAARLSVPERRRLQARQALRERKSDEAYQEWLRQLRDQTYVELRLEEAIEAGRVIALTSGEPAGIGPELCVRLAARERSMSRWSCIGDRALLTGCAAASSTCRSRRAARRRASSTPPTRRYVLAVLDRAIAGLPARRVRRHGHRAGAEERDQRRRHRVHRAHRISRRATRARRTS